MTKSDNADAAGDNLLDMLVAVGAERSDELLSAIARQQGVSLRKILEALSVGGLLAKIGRDLLGLEQVGIKNRLVRRRRGAPRNDSRHLDVFCFAKAERARRPKASRRSIAKLWLTERGQRVDEHSIAAAAKLLDRADLMLTGSVFD